MSARFFPSFLDSLSNNSLIFTNAYANGRQSIEALPSILASVPSFKIPFTSSPYANQEIQSLVSVFNKKAKLIHRIQFPAKNITNCAFGGKNTKELYVSTATKGMSKADLRKFRYSGFFFSVKTNAKGVLQKKFILNNEEKRSLL